MLGGKRSDTDIRTDAEDYVESIMASERAVRVDTPQSCGRKRQRSVPNGADMTISLLDSVVVSPSPESQKTIKKARCTLPTSLPANSKRLVVTSADVHVNADTSLEHLITKLSTDVREMFSDLSSRIDRPETGLEQKVFSKVAQ